MEVRFQNNKAFRLLSILILAFLIFAETRLDAIGSVYIPIQRITLLSIILGVLILLTILKRKVSVDYAILLFLIARIPYYYLISLSSYSTRLAFRAHYLIVLIAPAVFFCVYGMVESNAKDILIKLLKISTIVIAIQVHSSLLQLFLSGHALYQIKLSIGIPLGYSNTIASIVLIQAVLCYLLIRNKFYFIISSTSLLCTLSKSAFLIYLISMFLILLFESAEKKRIGIFIRYAVIIALILFVASYFFSEYFSVYSKALDTLFSNDLDTINNGRTRIFGGYLNDISMKPLLGWGLGKYNSINGMAHNLFLQSMFAGGIIGTVIYFAPIVIIIARSIHWGNRENKKILYALLLVSVAHGFVENVFFTVPCEFIFWLYLTLIYKEGIINDQDRVRNTQLQ